MQGELGSKLPDDAYVWQNCSPRWWFKCYRYSVLPNLLMIISSHVYGAERKLLVWGDTEKAPLCNFFAQRSRPKLYIHRGAYQLAPPRSHGQVWKPSSNSAGLGPPRGWVQSTVLQRNWWPVWLWLLHRQKKLLSFKLPVTFRRYCIPAHPVSVCAIALCTKSGNKMSSRQTLSHLSPASQVVRGQGHSTD